MTPYPVSLPVHTLHTPQGDSATVALHGAQVLSWRTADGTERLYLSPQINWQAVQQGQTAMRGGIPVCWPQFNRRGSLVKHGFARLLPWQVVDGNNDHVTLRLHRDDVPAHLLHDGQGQLLWPHAFDLLLHVQLNANRLDVSLEVRNTGSQPMPFTTALHSYLAVQDINYIRIEGADQQVYWDAAAHEQPCHPTQTGPIRFAGEVDRVYPRMDATLVQGTRRLRITQSASMGQTVMWNPGARLCATLPDVPPEDWQRFVCVEAAHIDESVVLPAGAVWRGGQHLAAL